MATSTRKPTGSDGTRRRWTKQELDFLKANAATKTKHELAVMLGRTDGAIGEAACNLKLKMKAKPNPRDGLVARVVNLHSKGMLDTEIAASVYGSSKHSLRVIWIRRRLGLKSNWTTEKLVSVMSSEKLKSRGQRLVESNDAKCRSYALHSGWPPETRPSHVKILNSMVINGPSTIDEISASTGLKASSATSSVMALLSAGKIVKLPFCKGLKRVYFVSLQEQPNAAT